MKHTLFLVPLLSALLLVGCEKSAEIDTSAKRSTLHLSLQDTPATKSEIRPYSIEKSISSIDFYVFDSAGLLENKVRVSGTGSADLEVSYGQKQVFADVNNRESYGPSIKTINDIKRLISYIENDMKTIGPHMSGMVDVDINSATQSVVIPVERHIARIFIESITSNLPIECGNLNIIGIWLSNIPDYTKLYPINAPFNSTRSGEHWRSIYGIPAFESLFNGIYDMNNGFNFRNIISAIRSNMNNKLEMSFYYTNQRPGNPITSFSSGFSWNGIRPLYTFPNPTPSGAEGYTGDLAGYLNAHGITDPTKEDIYNAYCEAWTARPTKLVIMANFKDTDGVSKDCFYTIPITPIERNKSYSVRVTISKKGSQDPDVLDLQDLDFATAVSASITVSDWETGFTYVEDFQ